MARGVLSMGSRGGRKCTLEELRDIVPPASTDTWQPVAHSELVEAIQAKIKERGWSVSGEEYGVSRSGDKLFGVMKLANFELVPGAGAAIGFRTSNDKRMALRGVAGLSVFVCENGCFSGSFAVYRKHTSGIDVGFEASRLVQMVEPQFAKLKAAVELMQATPVTDSDAKLSIFEAAEAKAIPSSDMLEVFDLWKHPPQPDFEPRTKWSLYNSFNVLFKNYGPARQAQAFEHLSGLFGLNQ